MLEMHEVPELVKLSATVAMLIGLGAAWFAYIKSPDLPGKIATNIGGLYRFLLNKWYFDELYNVVFVKPSFAVGRLFWKGGDIGIIDRFGPNGAAEIVAMGSRAAVKFQSGYLYTYALVMLLGLCGAATWVMTR